MNEDSNLPKTIRFSNGQTHSDFTPEYIISSQLNKFKGWTCSAGVNGLFIDWNGQIYPGTCLTNMRYSLGNINTKLELNNKWITCPKEFCHCNIEITLPKAKHIELDVTADIFNIKTVQSENQIDNPQFVMPALAWDRDSKYIMWALGKRCNYSCSYCDDVAHSKTDPFISKEILFNVVDYFQNNFSNGKILRYAFTGGEPTLNPHFLDVVIKIESLGNFVGTTTNGSRHADYYLELMKYSTINFSVHFEFINKNRFFGLIQKVVQAKTDNPDLAKRWIDIRFMIKPGGFEEAREFYNELCKIPGFKENIFSSFSPLRKANTAELMDYDPEEMKLIQQVMANGN